MAELIDPISKGWTKPLKELIIHKIIPAELKCLKKHTFRTDKVYLLNETAEELKEGFAICPTHNIEIAINPIKPTNAPSP
jgi:hypothetical protein